MEAVAEVKRKQDEELDVPSIKRALEVSDVSYGVSEEDCGSTGQARQRAAGWRSRANGRGQGGSGR